MSKSEISIETRRLTKAFGARTVLDRIDLEVAEGQSVALTGANGAGKTTLLRCLASLVRPTGGDVRWFGEPAGKDPASRRMIGMVAHESHLYPDLTALDNLLFAARMCGVRRPRQEAERWLREVGLDAHAHRLPSRMSKGMRQRLAVARALVHDPQILLLDEPFSGLDAAGAEWLLELLRDLGRRGRTICFATHDRRMVCRLADTVLELQAGRLQRQTPGAGSPPFEEVNSARAA
jgi:heme ABC exporter ATP-binding subunit CcmA